MYVPVDAADPMLKLTDAVPVVLVVRVTLNAVAPDGYRTLIVTDAPESAAPVVASLTVAVIEPEEPRR